MIESDVIMYTMLRTSHPATGVEHSLSCYFFNSSEKNLVVAGANVLRVFRLVPDLENKDKEVLYCGRLGPVWQRGLVTKREAFVKVGM